MPASCMEDYHFTLDIASAMSFDPILFYIWIELELCHMPHYAF